MNSPIIAPLALDATPPRRPSAATPRPPAIRGRLSRPSANLSLSELLPEEEDGSQPPSDAEPDAAPDAAAPRDGSPPRRKRRVRSRIARPKDSMPFARRRLAVPSRFRRRGAQASGSAHPAPAPVTAMDRSVLSAGYSAADDAAAAVDFGGGNDGASGAPKKRGARKPGLSAPQQDNLPPPNCPKHNLPAQSFTAKRAPNAGRRFFKCARPRAEQCDFFQWADAVGGTSANGGDTDMFIGDAGESAGADAGAEGVGEPCAAPPGLPGVTDPDDALSLFGHDGFRAGQRDALDILLAGRSALAVLPTAGGKSLVYQLAAALLPGLVIVVSPLVSLMRAAAASLPDCLPGAVLSAGASRADVLDVADRARTGRLKLLFVAPERLATAAFVHARLAGPHGPRVAAVVVDEAHCVAAWSHNFRVAYLRLPALLRRPLFRGVGDDAAPPPVLALTATATHAARSDICQRFAIRPDDVVAVSAARDDVSVTLSTVSPGLDAKASELVRRLRAEPFASMLGVRAPVKRTFGDAAKAVSGGGDGPDGAAEDGNVAKAAAPTRKRRRAGDAEEEFGWRASKRVCVKRSAKAGRRSGDAKGAQRAKAGSAHRSVIVYVTRQRDCGSVANYICASGLSTWGGVAAYHAGLESHERAGTQARFERGEIAVLVATVAFGMGVSYDVVGGVLHFDAPASVDALAQEIGRAARDGRPGFAHVLFCRADVARLRSRCHADGVDLGSVRAAVRRLCDSAVPLYDGRAAPKKGGQDGGKKEREDGAGNSDAENDDDGESGEAGTDGTDKTPAASAPSAAADADKHRLFVLALTEDDITRVLDMKFETGETIAAELEAHIPGLTAQPGAEASLSLQFFTETPGALADPSTSPLHATDCATLAHLLNGARARGGRYSAAPARRGLPPGALLGGLLARLRAGSHARVERDGRAVTVVASGEALARLRGLAGRDAADAVFHALRRAERTRVAAADDLVALLERADDEPSDAGQTRFLRDGMARHFERGGGGGPDDDDDAADKRADGAAGVKDANGAAGADPHDSKGVDDEATAATASYGIPDGRLAELRRGCRRVLAEEGCGRDTAQSGRQVARVVHGLDGPRLRAKEWWRCTAWGRFVDVPFSTALRVANEEVRARLRAGAPRR